MSKWLSHILIFALTSGKYQNKEKPLKRQRKIGLVKTLLVRMTDVISEGSGEHVCLHNLVRVSLTYKALSG